MYRWWLALIPLMFCNSVYSAAQEVVRFYSHAELVPAGLYLEPATGLMVESSPLSVKVRTAKRLARLGLTSGGSPGKTLDPIQIDFSKEQLTQITVIETLIDLIERQNTKGCDEGETRFTDTFVSTVNDHLDSLPFQQLYITFEDGSNKTVAVLNRNVVDPIFDLSDILVENGVRTLTCSKKTLLTVLPLVYFAYALNKCLGEDDEFYEEYDGSILQIVRAYFVEHTDDKDNMLHLIKKFFVPAALIQLACQASEPPQETCCTLRTVYSQHPFRDGTPLRESPYKPFPKGAASTPATCSTEPYKPINTGPTHQGAQAPRTPQFAGFSSRKNGKRWQLFPALAVESSDQQPQPRSGVHSPNSFPDDATTVSPYQQFGKEAASTPVAPSADTFTETNTGPAHQGAQITLAPPPQKFAGFSSTRGRKAGSLNSKHARRLFTDAAPVVYSKTLLPVAELIG